MDRFPQEVFVNRKRILFLTHRFPYPPNRGDRIRSYNLLKVLAGEFDVSLGCTTDEPISQEQVKHIKQFCSQVHVADLGKWSRRIRGGVALLGRKSITECMFYAPTLQQQIQWWQQQKPFDQILVFCSSMYPYITSEAFRDTPKIVDLVDVDSEKWTQLATERSIPMSWIYGREASAVRKLETEIGHSAEIVTLVSDTEAQLYRDLIHPTSPTVGVSNGVDTEYFHPTDTSPKSSNDNSTRLVFTGVLDYTPNVEGMVWFCKEIIPMLRKHGNFQLKVVGRRPIASIHALNQIEGVEIVGEVPDVRPYLNEADIAISPLKLARGIQNKVLEAMASGLPTVISPQSAEGIAASSGEEFWIAEDERDWIETLTNLSACDTTRLETGQAARALVERTYSWNAKLAPLADVIRATE